MKIKIFECKAAREVGKMMEGAVAAWLGKNPGIEIVSMIQTLDCGQEAIFIITIIYK